MDECVGRLHLFNRLAELVGIGDREALEIGVVEPAVPVRVELVKLQERRLTMRQKCQKRYMCCTRHTRYTRPTSYPARACRRNGSTSRHSTLQPLQSLQPLQQLHASRELPSARLQKERLHVAPLDEAEPGEHPDDKLQLVHALPVLVERNDQAGVELPPQQVGALQRRPPLVAQRVDVGKQRPDRADLPQDVNDRPRAPVTRGDARVAAVHTRCNGM